MSDQTAGSRPGSSSDDLYYVLDGQETIGPMAAASVQAMAANGSLRPQSNVNRVGDSTWVPASEIAFLTGYFPPSSAPLRGDGAFVGFWPRLGAYVIDYVILNVVNIALAFVFGMVLGVVLNARGYDMETIKGVSGLGGAILGLIVAVAYYAGFLASRWQATPGKRLLDMHVVRTDGQRVGWLLGFGRYLAYILSSLILGIGFLMIFWTDEKKALHDIICNTRVVRGKPGARARVVDAF